jgi:hypothetical protein
MSGPDRTEFDRIWPLLERSFELFPTHDKEDVWEVLVSSRGHLWCGPNSAVITRIAIYPKIKVLEVWVAGGKLSEITRMIPLMRENAKLLGCQMAVGRGRMGWGRYVDRANARYRKLTMHIEEFI